jgi:hypothetical protein
MFSIPAIPYSSNLSVIGWWMINGSGLDMPFDNAVTVNLDLTAPSASGLCHAKPDKIQNDSPAISRTWQSGNESC